MAPLRHAHAVKKDVGTALRAFARLRSLWNSARGAGWLKTSC
jgi:hypothetical protein